MFANDQLVNYIRQYANECQQQQVGRAIVKSGRAITKNISRRETQPISYASSSSLTLGGAFSSVASSFDSALDMSHSSSTDSASSLSNPSLSPQQPECARSIFTSSRYSSRCAHGNNSGGCKELPSKQLDTDDLARCIEQEQLKQLFRGAANKNVMCIFCKNNGEAESIYTSHSLKDAATGRTVCPLLKLYTCPHCGESGENAHTMTYCKKLKNVKRAHLIQQHQRN